MATLEGDTVDGRSERVIDPDELPAPACHTDAVLRVDVADGDFVGAIYDDAATEARQKRAQSRFDGLSRHPSHDEDADSDRDSPD